MRPAIIAQAVSRDHQNNRPAIDLFSPSLRESGKRQPPQQRHEEFERRRRGACLRHDLMQRAAGEPALGQMTVDGGEAEGKGAGGAKTLHFRQ